MQSGQSSLAASIIFSRMEFLRLTETGDRASLQNDLLTVSSQDGVSWLADGPCMPSPFGQALTHTLDFQSDAVQSAKTP